eukprot:4724450-Pyramimonas_sp.AAC.2
MCCQTPGSRRSQASAHHIARCRLFIPAAPLNPSQSPPSAPAPLTCAVLDAHLPACPEGSGRYR